MQTIPSDSQPRSGVALVTGAAGFIGCHLVERLVESGWAVRGIDDERSGDWSRPNVPVDRIGGALEAMSDEELRVACDGVGAVFHLAAEKHNTPGVTPERLLDVNVAATRRLYEAAGRAGVGKIVFTSSLYAYGSLGPGPMAEDDVPRPQTLYGVSKLAGEHLLRVAAREHGLRWSVARLFFVYGPRQLAAGGYPSVVVRNFARLRRGEQPVVNGDGKQELDYVYVDDCVDALVALCASDYDGCTFNVAGGTPVSIGDLTRLMLGVAGSSLEPVGGPADWTAGTRRWGSTSLVAERLGWRASVTLQEGLARVWESSR